MNEIYLIAHAFLESGYGRSAFAMTLRRYNYFGIAAYDSNPNYAMTFARNQGWTTPSKAIIGGAKFVRRGYIDQDNKHYIECVGTHKVPAIINMLLMYVGRNIKQIQLKVYMMKLV